MKPQTAALIMIIFFVSNTLNKIKITLLHQNIAGFISKKDILQVTLQELKENDKYIDILCLSETFIKQGEEFNLKLHGYNLATSFSRSLQRRGGTCIMCRENIEWCDIKILKKMSLELCFEMCGIELPHIKCIVMCIYRTPSSNPYVFLAHLEKLLIYCRRKIKTSVIITGDFNIDILKNNSLTSNFITLVESYNYTIHIKSPTRGNACLDQILCNNSNAIAEVLNLNLSDHNTGQLITLPCKNKVLRLQAQFVKRRDYSIHNIQKFYSCIEQLSWVDIYNETDMNKAFNYFHDIYTLFFNLCFPIVRIKLNIKDNRTRWISKGIKVSIKTKRKLRFSYYKNRNQESKLKYISYYKTLQKCIFNAQKLSNQKYIEKSKNKCLASWQLIKNDTSTPQNDKIITKIQINDNLYITSPIDIADNFNKYFIKLTSRNTITTHSYNYKIDNNNNSLFIFPTDINEIFKIIMNLRNTNAVGYDQLPTKIIKLTAKLIAPPLNYLTNLSFSSGIFPEKLKISVIKPIYKKDDKASMCNYRPIALIPILSKIIEKAMHTRIFNFLEKHGILTPQQNGFRRNKSTSLAAFNLVNKILENIDRKNKTIGIFYDMTKAFDFVDHELLLWKCEKYGIRGRSLEWLESYLSNRKQYVEIININSKHEEESYKSKPLFTKAGVPQGSILGPLLFIIYINDMPNVTKYECSLFADDIAVIIPDKNSINFNDEINNTMDKVVTWLKYNNLQINKAKSKYIQFGNKGWGKLNLNVQCEKEKLAETNSITFLGLLLDDKCTWNSHVNKVCSKINRFIYPLWRIPKISNRATALKAYHGYVVSNLRYGIIVWGNSVTINKAFIAQKRCVRAICGLRPETSCKPFFKELKLLTVPSLYLYEVSVFVKSHMYQFQKKEYYKNSVSRRPDKLWLPPCRTRQRQNNSYHMCIRIYNKLPEDMKKLNLNQFRKSLRDWLINKCYYSVKEFLL